MIFGTNTLVFIELLEIPIILQALPAVLLVVLLLLSPQDYALLPLASMEEVFTNIYFILFKKHYHTIF